MKKFAMFAILLASFGLTIGCTGDATTPVEEPAATTPDTGAETPAEEEGGE